MQHVIGIPKKVYSDSDKNSTGSFRFNFAGTLESSGVVHVVNFIDYMQMIAECDYRWVTGLYSSKDIPHLLTNYVEGRPINIETLCDAYRSFIQDMFILEMQRMFYSNPTNFGIVRPTVPVSMVRLHFKLVKLSDYDSSEKISDEDSISAFLNYCANVYRKLKLVKSGDTVGESDEQTNRTWEDFAWRLKQSSNRVVLQRLLFYMDVIETKSLKYLVKEDLLT